MIYKNWYAVQVAAGCEKKVMLILRERRAILRDVHIIGIEVPEKTEIVYLKSNKRKSIRKIILPGYVLIQILKEEVENEDGSITKVFPTLSHDIIQSTPHVIGFANSNKKIPRASSPNEIENIFNLVDSNFKEVKTNLLSEYYPGDIIDIIDGPFSGNQATIANIVGNKIITVINIFNTPTRVELSKNQIYKK